MEKIYKVVTIQWNVFGSTEVHTHICIINFFFKELCQKIYESIQ